jgi:poly(3-hydroxybutyrate) depolymerase
LLVGLHTWSGDYRQTMSIPYAEWCIEKGWVFVHPDFRGPNRRPEATGSEAAVQDIVDAVDYAKSRAAVDTSRIYLVGVSGGAYSSLLLAGRHPEIWAGVSAWVPLTDLKEWYVDCTQSGERYGAEILASVGGDPTSDPQAAEECRRRSPLTYLAQAAGVPIDLNAGIHDGHTGSIPIDHSLRAYNLLAKPEDRIAEEAVAHLVKEATVPESMKERTPADPLYGEKKVLLRRQSNNIRLTLFEGGHEIIPNAALEWLSRQSKPSRASTGR